MNNKHTNSNKPLGRVSRVKILLRDTIERFTGHGIINAKTLQHLRRGKSITRDDFFNLYFSRLPQDFFFVQIGANDGVSSDPIHPYITKYKLNGLVVEPQPQVFQKLEETYKGYPVKCVHAAVGERGRMKFYYVDSNNPTLTGLGSFRKDVILKNLDSRKKLPHGGKPEDYIVETEVRPMTFSELTKEVSHIHFLQIDCEGYDHEILKMMDFEKYAPDIINFESSHLSEEDRRAGEELLSRHGYAFFYYGGDTCAYRI